MNSNGKVWFALAAAAALFGAGAVVAQGNARNGAVGAFEGQSDVGVVNPAGTTSFDAASGVYSVASSGANLWAATDGFHMVWKKVSGDLSLTADIELAAPAATSSPHRKAFLIFRQSLDPDSMYADAAVHGNGETALQYRRSKGDTTQDIAFDLGAPRTVRLEKRGDTITLFVSMKGEPLHQVGASVKLHFAEPFYAGLGVCAHQDGAVEKATFSHVELAPLIAAATAAAQGALQHAADYRDRQRRAHGVCDCDRQGVHGSAQLEPRWEDADLRSRREDLDIAATGGEATAMDIGDATGCTGSHGLSPDGKWLAMTCSVPAHPGRRVYIVPSGGGAPRMVTENPDSYFHSWSPDGKTMLFTRHRRGASIFLRLRQRAARSGN